jgi:hypothetical protein
MRAEFRINLNAPDLCPQCYKKGGYEKGTTKTCKHKPIDTSKIIKALKVSLNKQFGAHLVQQTNDGEYLVLTVE